MAGVEQYTGPWTYQEAAHLLRRTMFGVRQTDVTKILEGSMSQAVDLLIDTPSPISPPTPVYTDDLVSLIMGDPWDPAKWTLDNDTPHLNYVRLWWIDQMLSQPMSIVEKMVLFWSNHFATGGFTVLQAFYMFRQHLLLREHALGNFRQFAKEMTLDPAMLVFLNGNTNTKTGPNENYARELQELFTIGKGQEVAPGDYTTYTESDVLAAARVLTGWRDDGSDLTNIRTTFDDSLHDNTDKQFSARFQNTVITGRSGEAGARAELDDLITMIFAQQETARYLCRKLYRWFVNTVITPEIETTVIVPLAQTFSTGNYEIKPVLAQLFKSAHFFDLSVRGALIKNPVDLMIGTFRSFKVLSIFTATLEEELFPPQDPAIRARALRPVYNDLAIQQYDLLDPPSVAGLPAYYQPPQFDKIWINADTIQKRVRFVEDLSVAHYRYDEDYGYAIIDVFDYIGRVSDPGDAVTVVREWLQWIFPMPLSQQQHEKALTNFLGSITEAEWRKRWNDYASDSKNVLFRLNIETKLQPFLRYLLGISRYQLM